MIEYGRYCTPKIPEHLRLCQFCSLNEIKDEQHFMLNSPWIPEDIFSLSILISRGEAASTRCEGQVSEALSNRKHGLFHIRYFLGTDLWSRGLLNCTLYLNERQYLFDAISHKYPNFHPLSANDMILFLFNNVDPFISKKLGHFIFLAFEKRESRSLNIITI